MLKLRKNQVRCHTTFNTLKSEAGGREFGGILGYITGSYLNNSESGDIIQRQNTSLVCTSKQNHKDKDYPSHREECFVFLFVCWRGNPRPCT